MADPISMTLRAWMRANRWKFRELSAAWDVPHDTLKSWAYGWRRPRREMQEKIERLTGGCVSVGEWGNDDGDTEKTKIRNVGV
mgnify:CR=1 FL=1